MLGGSPCKWRVQLLGPVGSDGVSQVCMIDVEINAVAPWECPDYYETAVNRAALKCPWCQPQPTPTPSPTPSPSPTLPPTPEPTDTPIPTPTSDPITPIPTTSSSGPAGDSCDCGDMVGIMIGGQCWGIEALDGHVVVDRGLQPYGYGISKDGVIIPVTPDLLLPCSSPVGDGDSVSVLTGNYTMGASTIGLPSWSEVTAGNGPPGVGVISETARTPELLGVSVEWGTVFPELGSDWRSWLTMFVQAIMVSGTGFTCLRIVWRVVTHA